MVTNASVYAMEVRVRVKTPLISMAGLDLWPRYETEVSLSWRRESRGVQIEWSCSPEIQVTTRQ